MGGHQENRDFSRFVPDLFVVSFVGFFSFAIVVFTLSHRVFLHADDGTILRTTGERI